MSAVADRLLLLGHPLPQAAAPVGAYPRVVVDGELAWVSGHTGRGSDRPALRGVVGRDVTLEDAQDEAVRATLNLLAALEAEVGLERVTRPLFLRGYVRADTDWGEHPKVVDAASALLAEAFGPGNEPARAALGVASLPGQACVELEAVFGVAPGGK